MTQQALLLTALVFGTAFAGCTGGGPANGTTCDAAGFQAGNVYVNFTTTKTHFVVELWGDKAPSTVCNFLRYVEEGHYDNTCFHRIIPGFVVQGGGYDSSTCGQREKPTHEPIKLETTSQLRNYEQTLAMARTTVPDSATSQFYVNVANNSKGNRYDLDWDGGNAPGYAVFGKVVSGWDTVKRLELAGTQGGTPKELVVATKVVLTTAPS